MQGTYTRVQRIKQAHPSLTDRNILQLLKAKYLELHKTYKDNKTIQQHMEKATFIYCGIDTDLLMDHLAVAQEWV